VNLAHNKFSAFSMISF